MPVRGAAGWGPAAGAAIRSTPVRVAGTVAGMVLLLHGVDMSAALRSLARVDPGWLLASMLLTAAAYGLAVVEWGVLLRAAGGNAGWRRIASWQVQSVFVGAVVPGGAGGDAFRALHATRVAGRSRGLASLLCSRMAGSCGMAAWALLGAVLLRADFGWAGEAAAGALAAGIAVAWVAAFTAAPLLRRWSCGRNGRQRVAALVLPLCEALHRFRGRRAALVRSVGAGVLGWTLNLVSLCALGRAVGVMVGPQLFAVVVPLSLLTTLAPFAVSGIGLREGVLVALLLHAGVDLHRAGALAVLVDLQPLPVALCGALLCLGDRRAQRVRTAPAVSPLVAGAQLARPST